MACIEHVIRASGVNVSVIFDPPLTTELLHEHIDLAVTSDRIGFTGFSRLVDSTSENTKGFLTVSQLDQIRDRFGDKARDLSELLRLPPRERVREPAIDQYCSLVRLRAFDRNYLGKFLIFVRSPVSMEEVPFESYALSCIEASLHVAAYARCRSIYFAGFGGIDGSFSDDLIGRSLERIYLVRTQVHLELMHAYFKYWPFHGAAQVRRLAAHLAKIGEADSRGHVDAEWLAAAQPMAAAPVTASAPSTLGTGGLRIAPAVDTGCLRIKN